MASGYFKLINNCTYILLGLSAIKTGGDPADTLIGVKIVTQVIEFQTFFYKLIGWHLEPLMSFQFRIYSEFLLAADTRGILKAFPLAVVDYTTEKAKTVQ